MRSKSFAALLLILLVAGIPAILGGKREQYVFRSTYTFENRGDEPHILREEDATIILFDNNVWQTVTIRNATHGTVREYDDEDGNILAVMALPPEIPAWTTLVFSIEYVISSEDRPRPTIDPAEAGLLSDIPHTLVEAFCFETETFARNEDIESLAQGLAEGQTTVLDVVTRLLDWILENVTYGNFEVPKYPDETLEELQGDCDDQAILLISMLRFLGIPSLLQVGVVFSDSIASERTSWNGHLNIHQEGVGWHGWAMVYIPPWGWLPIDLTLTGSSEALEVILQAPEYESYVVTAFNVSRQAYIGDSRLSRDRLMSSDLYISVLDTVIKGSTGFQWMNLIYIGTGILAGTTFVVFVILINRRKQSLNTGFSEVIGAFIRRRS